MVLGICLVCSCLVSTAAIKLQGIQQENQRLDKIRNILVAGDLLRARTDLAAVYRERIEPVMIDRSSGERIGEDRFDALLNPEAFDIDALANDSRYGEELPAEADPAKIRRRPRSMPVYFVRGDAGVEKVILPVYGIGLWSTLYGFLALEKDLPIVAGITLFRHGETPGLGARSTARVGRAAGRENRPSTSKVVSPSACSRIRWIRRAKVHLIKLTAWPGRPSPPGGSTIWCDTG